MKISGAISLLFLSLQSWSLPVEDEFLTSTLSSHQSPTHLPGFSRKQQDPPRQSFPPINLPPPGQLPQGRPKPQAPNLPKAQQQGSSPKLPPPGQLPAKSTSTVQPRPQSTPLLVATKRDAECKSCPYGGCLNAGIIWTGEQTRLSCWTQGDEYNKDRTWVRHQIGLKPEDFCYVSPYDLKDPATNYRQVLPYCGTKSELNFYLPSAIMKTDLFTECSLCPYRDCEGLEFFQPGVQIDVNCAVLDGWLQISPSYENGTSKYFRTSDNCYISLSTVHEVVGNVSEAAVKGSTPNLLRSDRLPQCGPIPHLRLTDRPLLTDPSIAVKSNRTLASASLGRTPIPRPSGSTITPSYTRTTPRYTPSRPTNVPSRGVQVPYSIPTKAPPPRPVPPPSKPSSPPKQPAYPSVPASFPEDLGDSRCWLWPFCPDEDDDDSAEKKRKRPKII